MVEKKNKITENNVETEKRENSIEYSVSIVYR